VIAIIVVTMQFFYKYCSLYMFNITILFCIYYLLMLICSVRYILVEPLLFSLHNKGFNSMV